MEDQIRQALAIIVRSYKSHKLMSEYRLLDLLDYDAKTKALEYWDVWKRGLLQGLTLDEISEYESITQGDMV